MEDFRSVGREASVAFAITKYMPGYAWLSNFVTVAILAGFSSVILVMLLGQSRVFFSMSRDGLVPQVFSAVHPRFKTPAQVELALLRLHLAVRGLRPGRRRRRDDAHRNALRLHAGLRRRLDHAPCGGRTCRAASPCRRCRSVAILGIVVCGAMIYGLGWTNWMRLG